MKVNMVKPVGIYAGVCDVPDEDAKRWLECGYAVEATDEKQPSSSRKAKQKASDSEAN